MDNLKTMSEEEKKEFDKADKKLDEIASNVHLKRKVFMKISDVDEEDALWFKDYCDKNFDKKQFLGIKLIRQIMERFDILTSNVILQLNQLHSQVNHVNERITGVEDAMLQIQEHVFSSKEGDKQKYVVPKTQGSNRQENKANALVDKDIQSRPE